MIEFKFVLHTVIFGAIDEFTEDDQNGEVSYRCGYGLVYVRFTDDADAVRFKLSYPEIFIANELALAKYGYQ